MKRKKYSNEKTKTFSKAVKHLALLKGIPIDVLHDALKQKFKYKSYCFLWKRKGEILMFVQDQIKKEEYRIYS